MQYARKNRIDKNQNVRGKSMVAITALIFIIFGVCGIQNHISNMKVKKIEKAMAERQQARQNRITKHIEDKKYIIIKAK